MTSELDQLKPIKIHFPGKDEEERGFYALLIFGMPVRAIENSCYIINERQRNMLSQKGIKYVKE